MTDNILTRAKAVFTKFNYNSYLTCAVYESNQPFLIQK